MTEDNEQLPFWLFGINPWTDKKKKAEMVLA